jgi:Mg-chelatase subunit ChlD
MTDSDYRHYILIVDRSGSMNNIAADAQGGIRHFAVEQSRLPGRATVSLYQFDTEHEKVFGFADLSKVKKYELRPRGGTALLDACGFAITQEGEQLASLPEDERPAKVIVLITTDGGENASKEYSKAQVKELTTKQADDYGWQFTYIGANQDSFAEAGAMGISAAATLDYSATSGGTKKAYAAASSAATRYSSGLTTNTAFRPDERDAAQEK